MEHLNNSGIGPDGQCTKLERFCTAINYMERKEIVENYKKINDAKGLKDWKKFLRRERNKKTIQRLEKLSDQKLDIEEINRVLDNSEMWEKYNRIVRRVKKGREVTDDELKFAMASLLISVKLSSMQRPGAVTNCTMEEYSNAIVEQKVTIIKVMNHKTGALGSAKLTTSGMLTRRLHEYVDFVRPLLLADDYDDDNDAAPLFILKGSRAIHKIGNIETYLQDKLKIIIPSSTKARKIGATVAAKNLGYAENEWICDQMSHTMAVHSKNYKATKGLEEAAKAFQAMETLRQKNKHQASASTSASSLQSLHLPQKSSKWTDTETSTINKLFKSYIEKKALHLCEKYEKEFCRGKKNIQDKVRNNYK